LTVEYSERVLEEALNRYFHFSSFRPGQLEVIRAVLAGEDVLAVMPTGGGKSLCYQLPALLLPGPTLVISPLVALMKDQVDGLWEKNLRQAAFINSQLTPEEQRRRLQALEKGAVKLLYVAPERLRNRFFLESIARTGIDLLVVDEAHCVSQWGHDFRPDYLSIAGFYRQLPVRPRVLALTATATPRVQQDIIRQLDIPRARRVLGGSDRPNLFISVRRVADERERLDGLRNFLVGRRGAGIIYTATRREAAGVAAWLHDTLRLPVAFYHAGLEAAARTRIQESFIRGELPLVVATNAFGMGIDKEDIRFVVHYNLPASLEAYYQEIGRAGRDGRPADCLLFFLARDKALQEWMINNDTVNREVLAAFWRLCRDNMHEGRVIIPLEQLALHKISETQLRLIISQLEKLDVYHLVDRDPGAVLLEPCRRVLNAGTAGTVLREAARRGEERKNRLNALVNWINSSRCRRVGLLGYFGEKPTAQPERCCDNCYRAARGAVRPSADPLPVLELVHDLPRPLGRSRLAEILRGSRARKIQDAGYDKLRHFGRLAGKKGREVLALIDRLLGDGYLATEGTEYPVVVLTDAGREALVREKARPEADADPGRRAADDGPAGRETAAGREKTPRAGDAPARGAGAEGVPSREEYGAGGHAAVTASGAGDLRQPGRGAVRAEAWEAGAAGRMDTADGAQAPEDGAEGRMARTEELFRQGMRVAEIAACMNLTAGAVENYLARLVAAGRIPVEDLVPWEVRAQIYRAMEQVGLARLKPVKQLLPAEIPCSAIRYVRAALLRRMEEESE